VRTAVIDVRASASLRASARVGVVVPKYKHNGVERNLLKRRLRELIRLEWLPLLPPMDLVVRVTPPAYERDFATLRSEMQQLLPKLLRAWPASV
jgi:ribonuclease P protein component